MENEQSKQAAKEFCDKMGITNNRVWYRDGVLTDIDYTLTQFLESLLDSGKMVDSCVQSSGKEVTDQILKQYFDNHSDCFADSEGSIYPIPAMTYNQIVKIAKWLLQFKSSHASTEPSNTPPSQGR